MGRAICLSMFALICVAAQAAPAPQSSDSLVAVTPGCPVGAEADALEAAFRVLFARDMAAGTNMFFVTCGLDSARRRVDPCPEFLSRFSDLGVLIRPDSARSRFVPIMEPPDLWYPGGVVCGVSHICWHSETEATVPLWCTHSKVSGKGIDVRVTKADSTWSGVVGAVGR